MNIKSNPRLLSTLLVALLMSVMSIGNINATVVEIDGVCYDDSGTGIGDGEAIISGINQESIPAEVVIPEKVTINGKECVVTRIHRSAFAYNTIVTSVTLPAGLKYIDNYALFTLCFFLT